MTRKKFVKKLMGWGVSRNHANLYATHCRLLGISYAARYKAMLPMLGLTKAAKKATVSIRMAAGYFNSSLARVAAAAKKLAESLLGSFTTVQPFHVREEPHGDDYGVEITGRHFLDGTKHILSTVDEVHTWDPVKTGANIFTGVDLAAGPDFTGWQPIIRHDTVVINAEPVMPPQYGISKIIDEIEKGLRK